MKQNIRTQSYRDDLDAIEAFIAQDKPQAGVDMWLLIDAPGATVGRPGIYVPPRFRGRHR